MSAIIKSEMISRRKALSLIGLAAAFGLAAAPTVLTVSDAEAQTAGMERRQERRAGRHERREERRAGRHERREERRAGRTERREERRTGTNTSTGTTTGTAK
jgi:Ni/Co efflux regulator RcnB